MNQQNKEQNEQNNHQGRIEKKHNYFYKITNLINGKYYYGIHSTDNIDDGYMGGGTLLKSAQKKHGKENFIKEIIQDYPTRKEASDHEYSIVNYNLVNLSECYNLRPGGDNNYVYDDAHRKRRSEKNIEVMQRLELRERISNTLKGRKVPKDVISKRVKNFTRRIICEINGIVYDTLKEVILKFDITEKQIKLRCESLDECWKSWNILNSEQLIKNKKNNPPLPYYYMIDGVRYETHIEVTNVYNIDYFKIRYRCNSNLDKYKNWLKCEL